MTTGSFEAWPGITYGDESAGFVMNGKAGDAQVSGRVMVARVANYVAMLDIVRYGAVEEEAARNWAKVATQRMASALQAAG